ncbi:MAG: hypothetical protein JWM21_2776 [Acidobacteria bacterium]|nr:hypothetical protein [Acidobacteriota bacterium]
MEPNHEEFKADLDEARRDFEAGNPQRAVDGVISARWKWRYAKDPERIKLLREMYEWASPLTQENPRWDPQQLKLLFELYSLWPKLYLEEAILKHSFPEPPSDPYVVSGAESVQLAARSVGFGIGPGQPVALSRGRHWLKLWDVETGEVIYATEHSLELIASFIGRDTTHVLFAQPFSMSTGDLCWSASFRETLRQIFCPPAGTREKSHYENVKTYRLRGEIENMVSVGGRREDIEHEVTIKHEEIMGYLPAGTTTFTARSNEYYGPQVDDLRSGDQINATLAVEDDERWIRSMIGPGRGLRGMYGFTPTTPISSLCLSSDGTLALRNGNGNTFGIWNVWTGDRLREFEGHTDRVTCLCLSVDVSFALSGSEDRTLKLWKPITAECVQTFVGHESAITAVCISLDATKILSADRDGVIKLWDSKTGQCLRTIQAHSQSVSGLHLTMDGRFAASGSWDKTVKLWNLNDGSCMKSLEHSDWVTSVDMTADGKYLVSSSYEGTKVWELVWRLEPHDIAAWDEGARPYMEILLHANGAWDGKLSTSVDMTEEEIKNSLHRQGPSWTAWHAPLKKNDWHRVWHLNWNIDETLGHAGYGWLSEAGREGSKYLDQWWTAHRAEIAAGK